ncbi:MAG: outer membrane beta-barrel protein [Saprospiraceae bacterium]|nr:outer membrane beta-barrel protein [Saprospiraceae bacterium]
MKRNILSLFFLTLSIVSVAQFNSSLDLVGGFDRSSASSSFGGLNADPKLFIRGGANFNFRLFDQIMMKTGIRYTQLGSVIKLDDLRWPSEIGPNGFEPDPTLPRYIHNHRSSKYIEIPLHARYEFSHKKNAFYIEAGFSPQFYINTTLEEKTNLDSESMVIDETEFGERRLILGYVIGFGMNHNYSDKIQLFFQPMLRYYPSSSTIFPGSPIDSSSLGLEFGVRRAISLVNHSS